MASFNINWVFLATLSVCCVGVLSQADGSFWWTNRRVLDKASESRNKKLVDLRNEAAETTTPQNIITSNKDCTCVHQCKCQVAFGNTTLPNKDDGHFCSGPDQVCCHIIKLPIPAICFDLEAASKATTTTVTPPTSTTTTRKSTTSTTTAQSSYRDNFIYPDDNRIVEHSFLLKLYLRERSWRQEPTRICGASLISKSSAITAQHCVRGSRFAPDFMIKSQDGQLRIVTQIIRHPDYYSGGLYNDLAILTWEDNIHINDRVDVVDLPSHIYPANYSSCALVALNASQGDSLEQVNEDAELINHDECESRIKGSKWGPRFKLHKNFTCTETNRIASCTPSQGNIRDGHPLVCFEGNREHPVLVGVMSWYSCQKAHPDVLVDVRSNMEWISGAIDFN